MFIVLFNTNKYSTLLMHVFAIIMLMCQAWLIKPSTIKISMSYLTLGLVWSIVFILGYLLHVDSPYVGEFKSVIYIIIMILFTCMFLNLRFKKYEISILMTFYFLCNFMISLNILLNYLTNNFYLDGRSSLMILGVYKDPNYVASLIVPAIFWIYIELKECNHLIKKVSYYIALSVMMFAILATGSRAALLSVLTSAIVYIFLKLTSNEINAKRKIKGLLFLFVMMIAFCYILTIYSENRFTNISGYIHDIRVVIWNDALHFWLNSPIIGNGVNAASNFTLSCWYNRATHNCFLDLMGDSGVVGVMCFLGILMNILKRIQNKNILLPFIIICFLPMAFINGFYGFNFWFSVCLIKLFVDFFSTKGYVFCLKYTGYYKNISK